MIFRLWILLPFLAFELAACWANTACSAEREILIVVSKLSEMYFEVEDITESQLLRHFDNKIKILKTSAGELGAESQGNLNRFALIIGIGTKAARSIAKLELDTPKFYVLVPKITLQKILQEKSNKTLEKNYGIYLDQPFLRELNLAKLIVTNANTAGVILGPMTRGQKPGLIESSKKAGLSLKIAEFKNEQAGYAEARDLLQKTDVILTLPDPLVLSPQRAKWLLYQSYNNKVPIISFSKSYVEAGALAAVYSTPRHIGWQAGEVAVDILSKPGSHSQYHYPTYFDVAVNYSVARSLGLDIADEADLLESMKRLEQVSD